MEIRPKKKQRVEVKYATPETKKAPDSSLKFVSSWGEKGKNDGQFRMPCGIAVGMDGNVYVSDWANDRIQCFDFAGVFIRKWGTQGTGNGEFNYPYGLAIGLCDGINRSIMDAMRAIPELYGFPPGVLPLCVAYMGDECIAVTEEINNRIQLFNTNGRFIRKWGTRGGEDGQFRSPTGCCIDQSSGILYVADSNNDRIQAFDLDGTFICKWGSYGTGDGQFDYPRHISITANGVIYVCDRGNSRISCFTSQGGFVRHIPTAATKPLSVMINEIDDTLYVCDLDNHCIYHFRLDGTLIDTSASFDNNSHVDFGSFRAIVRAANNMYYVADFRNHRIVRLTH